MIRPSCVGLRLANHKRCAEHVFNYFDFIIGNLIRIIRNDEFYPLSGLSDCFTEGIKHAFIGIGFDREV
jgi:hypothetical protein